MKTSAKLLLTLNQGGPLWARGMSAWKDFTNGAGNLPAITDTHAATIYAPNRAGVYSPFAANELTRTDLGLQTVPTRAQVVAAPTNVAAFSVVAGAGSGVTRTSNFATAPDGTATASRLQYVNAGNFALVQQALTVTNATVWTHTVWLRTNDGGTYSMTLGDNPGGSTPITVTPAWQQFQFSYTTASTSAIMQINGPAGAGSYDILAWGANSYAGAFAVPPILSAATVNGNQQVISGLGTQLATGVAGIIQINPYNAAGAPHIVQFGDGTNNNRAFITESGSRWRLGVFSGGGGVADIDIAAAATGLQTFAFVVAANYFMARKVGVAAPSPDTSGALPVGMDRLGFGGNGNGATENMFGVTTKAGLKFLAPGDDPATAFAQMFTQAQLAAA